MILGTNKLLELIQNQKLIEGFDENNLNVEGCGIDLRVGEVYEMEETEGFLKIETRKTPDYKLVSIYEKNKEKIITIKPGKIYSCTTIETINTPENLMGWFIPRSTFYKCGIVVQGIRTDPGYKGKFSFILINTTNREFKLEMGTRIANMVFIKVDGKTHSYIGQWQGGRAFIPEEEIQTKQNF